MSTLSKIASAAAVVAVTATSAFAVTSEEIAVPGSLATSELVASSNIDSVSAFNQHVRPGATLNSAIVKELPNSEATAIASTLDGDIPGSLAGSRLLQN